MIQVERLAQLASAVRLGGGIRAVSALAQLDASNVSRFLRSARGLSTQSIRMLEAALGRPNDKADPSTVIIVRSGSIDDDLARGLAWYFPEGGEIARAAWSGMRAASFRKLLRGIVGRYIPEVYAIRDHFGTRLVLILAAGLILPEEYFETASGPGLRWWNRDRHHATLNLGDDPESWLQGAVSPDVFDSSWPDPEFNNSAADLIAVVKRIDITFSEAIRRVLDNR